RHGCGPHRRARHPRGRDRRPHRAPRRRRGGRHRRPTDPHRRRPRDPHPGRRRSRPGGPPLTDAPPSDPRAAVTAVRQEVGKVVVGQDGTLSGLVTALLVGGHVLLEVVPGVAKTLIAKALAAALDLEFTRVQFTPDLMPSDVTGQLIYRSGQDGAAGRFEFREGPVFTNLLLAD